MKLTIKLDLDTEGTEDEVVTRVRSLIEYGTIRDAFAEADLAITNAIVVGTGTNDEVGRRFVEAAKELEHEGEIEVDEDARVSRSNDDEGAYVQAWLWVSAYK